jgi:hypothetical protein
MRESVTYQAIIEEGAEKGRLQGMRKLLLRLGRKKLGPPTKRMIAALGRIADAERLELLAERLGEVKSWKELLAE